MRYAQKKKKEQDYFCIQQETLQTADEARSQFPREIATEGSCSASTLSHLEPASSVFNYILALTSFCFGSRAQHGVFREREETGFFFFYYLIQKEMPFQYMEPSLWVGAVQQKYM